MLTLDLPPELEQRLSYWAEKMHCSKSYCMQRALEQFLDEEEEYIRALSVAERIQNKEERTYTLEEIKRRHALLDA